MYKQLNYHRAIDLILHHSVFEYKQKNSKSKANIVLDGNKKGAVAVFATKDDLQAVHGMIVTSKESVYSFANKGYTHWTPNTYNYLTYTNEHRRSVQKHEKYNLQQVNTFVMDIDTKINTIDEVISTCVESSIGEPTLVLETPKGYHVYFVLKTPLFISNKNDYRGLLVAERIAENIKQSIDTAGVIVGVDRCAPFGIFRLPTADNIRYFNEKAIFEVKTLIEWSAKHTDDIGYSLYGRPVNQANNYDALIKLLQEQQIEEGLRNYAIFTLATTLYANGSSKKDALQVCSKMNQSFTNALRSSEVGRCVASAFSGRYKAPKKEFLELICGGEVKYPSQGFYKHAKSREERENSHLHEWETDLIEWIEDQALNGNGFIEMSQRELAQATAIPLSALKELFKKSKQLIKKVSGKGRYAKTYIATVCKRMLAIKKNMDAKATKKRESIVTVAIVTTVKQAIMKGFEPYLEGAEEPRGAPKILMC